MGDDMEASKFAETRNLDILEAAVILAAANGDEKTAQDIFENEDWWKQTITKQAEISGRSYPQDGCHASEGEAYYSEWSVKVDGSEFNRGVWEIIWQFNEVKGHELEDASDYPWYDYRSIKRVD